MYVSKIRFLAFLQLVLAYRVCRWLVWNPASGYGFPCSSRDALQDLLAYAPHFEALGLA